MNKSEEKQVIVELTNGQKVRGTLVQVDKINLKMILENVKQEANGKEETLDKLEIKKSDIIQVPSKMFCLPRMICLARGNDQLTSR